MKQKNKAGHFVWKFELAVDPVWVQDGFDPDAEQLQDIMLRALSVAEYDEVRVKVLARPDDASIAKAQGFGSVAQYRKACWKGGARI